MPSAALAAWTLGQRRTVAPVASSTCRTRRAVAARLAARSSASRGASAGGALRFDP